MCQRQEATPWSAAVWRRFGPYQASSAITGTSGAAWSRLAATDQSAAKPAHSKEASSAWSLLVLPSAFCLLPTSSQRTPSATVHKSMVGIRSDRRSEPATGRRGSGPVSRDSDYWFLPALHQRINQARGR